MNLNHYYLLLGSIPVLEPAANVGNLGILGALAYFEFALFAMPVDVGEEGGFIFVFYVWSFVSDDKIEDGEICPLVFEWNSLLGFFSLLIFNLSC